MISFKHILFLQCLTTCSAWGNLKMFKKKSTCPLYQVTVKSRHDFILPCLNNNKFMNVVRVYVWNFTGHFHESQNIQESTNFKKSVDSFQITYDYSLIVQFVKNSNITGILKCHYNNVCLSSYIVSCMQFYYLPFIYFVIISI
ncbi:hypothetical protein A3Q56_01947 [Intoshia linei]|uniref:Uncharacterized protein n=1 Tax=Intoshia linei TaxID=1819745 RepID=A0A177B9Q3_9BILA|nr:hypothetical protein A3Q56_01947 [Intoshia linei]